MTATTVSVLDVPDITALEKIARDFAAAVEAATHLTTIAATAQGLPDALTFGPGKKVIEVIMTLAELAPDPARLAAFAEALPLLLTAVKEQQGRNEHMAADQLAGDVEQHVPA